MGRTLRRIVCFLVGHQLSIESVRVLSSAAFVRLLCPRCGYRKKKLATNVMRPGEGDG